MNASQYDFVVKSMKYIRPDLSMPLYRTVCNHTSKALINFCFPKWTNVRLRPSTSSSISLQTEDIKDHTRSSSRQLVVEDGTGFGRAWPSDQVAFNTSVFPITIGNRSVEDEGWSVSRCKDEGRLEKVSSQLGAIWMVDAGLPSNGTRDRIIETELHNNCTSAESDIIRYLHAGCCL